jgi:uncharacterized glyoxalase superfamily protein PhnB
LAFNFTGTISISDCYNIPVPVQILKINNMVTLSTYLNFERTTEEEETKHLFDELSAGGKVEQELQVMFWGDYYGSCRDKFGIQWMFNCSEK